MLTVLGIVATLTLALIVTIFIRGIGILPVALFKSDILGKSGKCRKQPHPSPPWSSKAFFMSSPTDHTTTNTILDSACSSPNCIRCLSYRRICSTTHLPRRFYWIRQQSCFRDVNVDGETRHGIHHHHHHRRPHNHKAKLASTASTTTTATNSTSTNSTPAVLLRIQEAVELGPMWWRNDELPNHSPTKTKTTTTTTTTTTNTTTTEGTTRIAPIVGQYPTLFLVRGLPVQPIVTTWHRHAIQYLQRPTIRKLLPCMLNEFYQYYIQQQSTGMGGWAAVVDNNVSTGRWSTLYFLNQGRWDRDVCDRACPLLFQHCIESLPGLLDSCIFGNAFLSILQPGTRIDPHTGPTNIRHRLQFTLQCCEGGRSTSTVGKSSIMTGTTSTDSIGGSQPTVVNDTLYLSVLDQHLTWTVGEAFCFDDSLIHSVESNGATDTKPATDAAATTTTTAAAATITGTSTMRGNTNATSGQAIRRSSPNLSINHSEGEQPTVRDDESMCSRPPPPPPPSQPPQQQEPEEDGQIVGSTLTTMDPCWEKARIVLIVDLWHPALHEMERECIRQLFPPMIIR